MKCPKDHVDMGPMTMLNTVIDVCPLCNGCWLDKNELERITRSRKNAVSVKLVGKKATENKCPRCKGKLHEGSVESVKDLLLDECDLCGGLWLDRGELTRLLSAGP